MPTTDAYRCFQHTQGGRTASCIPHCYIFSSLTSFCKERQPYKRKLACMKSELLVIADQHAAVNTFPGLVHTARQAMKAGGA